MASSNYYPHIDGLRAISVGLVVLYHAQIAFPGGFVGVDAFFVISGFLITSLMMRDLDREKFTFENFFVRRMRRILPAQWAVVSTVVFLSWLLLLLTDFQSVLKTTIANCFMLANVSLWAMVGYFNNDAKLSPLLHLWSLAVEEQFYLLFPFLFVALWRLGRKIVYVALIAIGIGSFVISAHAAYQHPSANFFLLPFRAWELLLGAILAVSDVTSFLTNLKNRWINDLVGSLGVLMLCGSALIYNDQTRFPGITALLPCFGAFLLIVGGTQPLTWTCRILSTKVLVAIGRISYSLYLWHWPLLVFVTYWLIDFDPWFVRAGAVVVAIPISYVSWRFIEQPWRKSKEGPQERPIGAFRSWMKTTIAFNATLATVAVALLLLKYQPLMPQVAQQYASGVRDRKFLYTVTVGDARNGDFPRIGIPSNRVDVLLWGDSHAMAVAPAIDSLCKKYGLTGAMATHSSTPPLLNFSSESEWGLNEKNVEFSSLVTEMVAQKKIELVVLVGIWGQYGNVVPTAKNFPGFEESLKLTIAKLQASGARVAIMLEVPKQSTGKIPRLLAREAFLGHDIKLVGVAPEKYAEQYSAINERVKRSCNSDVCVLDPTSLFLNERGLLGCDLDGYSIYVDSHHLTVHGAQLLVPLFDQVFESTFGSMRNTDGHTATTSNEIPDSSTNFPGTQAPEGTPL